MIEWQAMVTAKSGEPDRSAVLWVAWFYDGAYLYSYVQEANGVTTDATYRAAATGVGSLDFTWHLPTGGQSTGAELTVAPLNVGSSGNYALACAGCLSYGYGYVFIQAP